MIQKHALDPNTKKVIQVISMLLLEQDIKIGTILAGLPLTITIEQTVVLLKNVE